MNRTAAPPCSLPSARTRPAAALLCVAVLLCVAALPTALQADDDVEAGVLYSFGQRTPDRFNRGLHKFRSNVRREISTVSDADPFHRVDAAEIFFRFGGALGEHSYFGMAAGQYRIPFLDIHEYRTDEVFMDLRSRFDFSYFLFQYHYKQYWRRGWSWELGAGTGFIPVAYWHTEGRRISRLDNLETSEFTGFHTARFGAISRLEAGLHRMLGRHGFFRAGLRYSYGFVGPFYGTVNDAPGDWYFLDDGSLALLSAFEAAWALRNVDHPVNGNTTINVIREKAYITLGVSELQFSLGVRF